MFFILLILLSLVSSDAMSASFIDDQIKKLEDYKLTVIEKCDLFEASDKISCDKLSLSLGESHPYIHRIRHQLMIKGFLFDEKIKDDYVYDDSLKTSIEHFQKQNFLPTTGVFDTKTCKTLNHPLKDELARIDKNIERLLELKNKIKNHKKAVVVNIPQYALLCIDNGCVDMTMNVIVGSPKRPTPIRTDAIYSIMINPSWTIPESILLKDKIKVFSKKPDYFESHGYRILDHEGDELEASSIDWEDVRKYPTRYKIKQMPGKKNALGLFKFAMNNLENIHMHGTNQPNLFSKGIRSLSSGCIRLEDPKSFARWLLNEEGSKICKIDNKNQSKCLVDAIAQKLKKSHTQNLFLNQPVPVIFSYITMWSDSNGNVYTSDPYRKDL